MHESYHYRVLLPKIVFLQRFVWLQWVSNNRTRKSVTLFSNIKLRHATLWGKLKYNYSGSEETRKHFATAITHRDEGVRHRPIFKLWQIHSVNSLHSGYCITTALGKISMLGMRRDNILTVWSNYQNKHCNYDSENETGVRKCWIDRI